MARLQAEVPTVRCEAPARVHRSAGDVDLEELPAVEVAAHVLLGVVGLEQER